MTARWHRARVVCLAACGVLGLGGCSSDSRTATTSATAAVTTTVDPAAGVTTPSAPTATGSPGTAGLQCAAFAKDFGALSQAASTGKFGDISAVFASLSSSVPADLRDDVKVLSAGYSKIGEVVKTYNGDLTKALADPAGQQAIAALNTTEFQTATTALSAWVDGGCKS